MDAQNIKVMSNLLKVLANDNRMMIVCKLMEKNQTVGELQAAMSHISQAAISQHLSVMKANHLVDCEKNGMHSTYFIADSRLSRVFEVLKENYCELK